MRLTSKTVENVSNKLTQWSINVSVYSTQLVVQHVQGQRIAWLCLKLVLQKAKFECTKAKEYVGESAATAFVSYISYRMENFMTECDNLRSSNVVLSDKRWLSDSSVSMYDERIAWWQHARSVTQQ